MRNETWERILDNWVTKTDLSTILLERAAEYCAMSEGVASDSMHSAMVFGEYLGLTDAIATLAAVPVDVVWTRVRFMAGVEDAREVA